MYQKLHELDDFEVGMRVRVLTDRSSYYIGKEGIITEISSKMIYVESDDWKEKQIKFCWSASDLQPLTEKRNVLLENAVTLIKWIEQR